MPFQESSVMDKRADLAQEMIRGARPVTELCAKYGVSRPTAYLWKKRFLEQGRAGMAGRSRRPLDSPDRTPQHIEDAICKLRAEYDVWGNVKIHRILLNQGLEGLPSCRTVGRILHRRGCTKPPAPEHDQVVSFARERPNELWQLDFKGAIALRPRPQPQRAIPLTIIDDCSRFNIALRIVPNHRFRSTWEVLWEAMDVYGMPECILTDNESVFRGHQHGITAFRAHLWRLGIEHINGRPHHPQTQGKVERLHGTMEREVIRGRMYNSGPEAQTCLDDFRDRYNHIRPHEALDLKVPAEVYRPSERRRPPAVPPVEYTSDAELRRVSPKGCITVRNCKIRIGEGICGEYVCLHEQDKVLEIEYANHIVRSIAWDDLRSDEWR